MKSRHVIRWVLDRWWAFVLAFAVVTLGGGFTLERRVSRELEAGVAAELTTIRDVNVAALREWLVSLEHAAEHAATEPELRKRALELFALAEKASSREELAALPLQREIASRLSPTLRHWKLEDFVLVSGSRVVSSNNGALVGAPVPARDIPEAVSRGETTVELPHKSKAKALEDRDAVMWAITPVKDDAGQIRGVLALRVSPEASFARLLKTARFGESGETYAFDHDALLLTPSRFEPTLVRAGLLAEGERSMLRIGVRDPGVDLTQGGAPARVRPLTRAATSATQGDTGVDVSGYRDYRGVVVVGAWTWLPKYGFGVTTELDRDEAFRSTAVIRRASRALTAIIVLCTAVVAGAIAVVRRVDRRAARTERLGQYTLERRIGEGGMGVVYLARHALLRRPTAIKVLKKMDADDPMQARFEREVQTMASLSHPNTVAVYDYGRTRDGVFYYAMELLEGRSLEEIVETTGPLPEARVVHVLLQMLGSLGEAHQRGLVHRDVKPANVMLTSKEGLEDLVKVVDFGLVKSFIRDDGDAQLTQANTILGTPLYMSPESIKEPETVDHRSDLYAVGAVAYFLLSGQPVFDARSTLALLTKHMTEEPRALADLDAKVSPELEALVADALAKLPEDRPASAADMITRLERIREMHGLRWTQQDARAFWVAHPKTDTPAKASPRGTSETELAIALEGRSQS